MFSDIVISAKNISKAYELYDSPEARLKRFIMPAINKLIGATEKKYHKEFWALQGIDFEIRRGESVGILGRNGSGKSTLLQIITGTLAPTTGEVFTQGRICALLELGSGFNPEFTGRENIFLNGALLGLTTEEIENKFDQIASFADIGKHLDQPVKTYSSGMMVRLAFAVQVQTEPNILIVDEALAVGDALFQKRCFQRIEKLLNDGVTLLFVSHDIESVRTLTSRAILLNHGQQLKCGPSPEVILEYRKLLHNDEAVYFSNLTHQIMEKSQQQTTDNYLPASPNTEKPEPNNGLTSRSENLSFGDFEAKILRVETLNADNKNENIFYPKDIIKIRLTCQAAIELNKLNVGIRIRNKEGVKIYSWGTLNQDMFAMANGNSENLFWNNFFTEGQKFSVDLEFKCNLGMNLYEIQACISHEETPDYLKQKVLHWVDEACFFQVHVKRHEYFFGGVADLEMSARW